MFIIGSFQFYLTIGRNQAVIEINPAASAITERLWLLFFHFNGMFSHDFFNSCNHGRAVGYADRIGLFIMIAWAEWVKW
jgi:hypothetical protein